MMSAGVLGFIVLVVYWLLIMWLSNDVRWKRNMISMITIMRSLKMMFIRSNLRIRVSKHMKMVWIFVNICDSVVHWFGMVVSWSIKMSVNFMCNLSVMGWSELMRL